MNNCANKSDNTNYAFKILYVIGIIYIVAGHCSNAGFSIFYELLPVYGFHLALFIFSSGYFYKEEYENNVLKAILNKAKKLILPLYLWNLFYGLLVQYLKIFDISYRIDSDFNLYNLFIAPIMHGHQFMFNLGGWFVIPLFMVHIFNIVIRTLFKKFNIKINEFLYLFVCCIFGTAGVTLSMLGYNKDIALPIDRLMCFIPFYAMGIFYKKYEKRDNLGNLAYFGIILLLILITIFINNCPVEYSLAWSEYTPPYTFLPFFAGGLGIFFYLRITKILAPVVGKSKTINLIANNTFSIMIHHMFGFFLLNLLYAFLSFHTPYFTGFDMHEFKNNIFYLYAPHGLKQMYILYLIAGVSISIFIEFILNKIKTAFMQRYNQESH